VPTSRQEKKLMRKRPVGSDTIANSPVRHNSSQQCEHKKTCYLWNDETA
jgi:hypothetical protein